ncbi:MAG: hypothetical protein HY719_02475 [Planctomycetes bacterium]|nr:hypothetical protein [Planctomycetota bacterium]
MKVGKFRFDVRGVALFWGAVLAFQGALWLSLASWSGVVINTGYARGVQAYQAGDLKAATTEFKDLASRYAGDFPPAQEVLAKIYVDGGKFQDARKVYDALRSGAAGRREGAPNHVIGGAVILMKEALSAPREAALREQMGEALAVVEPLAERNADAAAVAGLACLELGRRSEAERFFHKAISPPNSREIPDHADRETRVPTLEAAAAACNGLGVCLARERKWAEALEMFQGSARYGLPWLDPHANIVRAYAAQLRDVYDRFLALSAGLAPPAPGALDALAAEYRAIAARVERDDIKLDQAPAYVRRVFKAPAALPADDPRVLAFNRHLYVLRMALALASQVDQKAFGATSGYFTSEANEQAFPIGLLHRLNHVSWFLDRHRARRYGDSGPPSRAEAAKYILYMLRDGAARGRIGARGEIFLREAYLAFLRPPPLQPAEAAFFRVLPDNEGLVTEGARSAHPHLTAILALVDAARGEPPLSTWPTKTPDLNFDRLRTSIEVQARFVQALDPVVGARAGPSHPLRDEQRLTDFVTAFGDLVAGVSDPTGAFTADETAVYAGAMFDALATGYNEPRAVAELRERNLTLAERVKSVLEGFFTNFPPETFHPRKEVRDRWTKQWS